MKKIWKNILNKINKFLEKIAKDNEETFGKGKLDCCNLNKDDEKNQKDK